MNKIQFIGLREGDIIRHNVTGDAYVVVLSKDDGYLAVRALSVTNPSEWELVQKADGSKGPYGK